MNSAAHSRPWPPGEAADHRRWGHLDFLRGVAILMVVFTHMHLPATQTALDDLRWILQTYGGYGVDLFFVLSGFLVGGLLLKEYGQSGHIEIGRFYIRRALKILPALYALLIFQLLANRHPWTTYLFQNLFMVPNYFGTSISQTWSLGVEEQFYIFMSAIFTVFSARKSDFKSIFVFLLFVCIAAFTVRCITVAQGLTDMALRQTQCRIDSLLIGVLLASVYWLRPARFEQLLGRRLLLWAVMLGGFGFAAVATLNIFVMRSIGFTVLAVAWGALILLIWRPVRQKSPNRAYWLVSEIGVCSYGIYLWHSLMQAPADALILRLSSHHVNPSVTYTAAMVLQLSIALVLGVLATRVIEWPVLKLREIFFPPAAPEKANSQASNMSTGLAEGEEIYPGEIIFSGRTTASNSASVT